MNTVLNIITRTPSRQTAEQIARQVRLQTKRSISRDGQKRHWNYDAIMLAILAVLAASCYAGAAIVFLKALAP